MTMEWRDVACRRWSRTVARSVGLLVGLNLAMCSLALGQLRYPGEHWERTSSPEALGWSSGKLQRALEYADINGTVMDDWTPLMIGAETGRAGVVRLLLDAGADVNARDVFGETALSIARKLDRAKVIELLRERGATE